MRDGKISVEGGAPGKIELPPFAWSDLKEMKETKRRIPGGWSWVQA
jgi:hypothetical protein